MLTHQKHDNLMKTRRDYCYRWVTAFQKIGSIPRKIQQRALKGQLWLTRDLDEAREHAQQLGDALLFDHTGSA
jgi:hypothetical protein